MKAIILNNTVVAVGEPIVNDRGILQIGNVEYQNCTAVDCDTTVQSGATYDGTVFTNPVPKVEVPQSVTPLQGLLAIDQAGMSVAYEAWANDPARTFAEKAFINRAQVWNRNDPLMIGAATALGMNDVQLDDLFILAGTL